MEIKAFRIRAFRSIKKTSWLPLSVDGITALVGQNESGKSAVLDALALGFSLNPNIQRNDFRSDSGYPEVALLVEPSAGDIDEIFEDFTDQLSLEIAEIVRAEKSIEYTSRIIEDESGKLVRQRALAESLAKKISGVIEGSARITKTLTLINSLSKGAKAEDEEEGQEPGQESDGSSEITAFATLQHVIDGIWSRIPAFVLFNEQSCYLPDLIEITKSDLNGGPGNKGASNFLAAAGVSVPEILKADDRALATLVKRSSARVTRELQNFWSQVLGKKGKITIDFELRHHSASKGEKSGLPYLLFWISEGDGERLHPSQRSKGTRWFISFFLEMLAAQNDNEYVAFLLDEPGAFLHARAQEDVLRLLERIDALRPIVYSTHSPYLIDQHKIYRVLAVERVDDEEGSETVIRRGLDLAASSPITLAPILARMGLNLSDQSVIKKSGNVLLEESSAHYYYLAFCKLLNIGGELSFVACGGVDSVRVIADLMTAWGIDYMLLVDDDRQGKVVCRDLKHKYGLSDEEAKNKFKVIDGFSSIEDVFSPEVFRRVVAKGFQLDETKANSEAVKGGSISKPMLAVNFFERVRKEEIKLEDLDPATVDRFRKFISDALGYFEAKVQ